MKKCVFFAILVLLGSVVYAVEPVFSEKMLKELTTIEKRHFGNAVEVGETGDYRLSKLEQTLMGRTFEDLPLERRMYRLKIASQKKMTTGMAIPRNVRMGAGRIRNDEIEIVESNEGVGIIDGLMKLYAPGVYARFKDKNEYFRQFDAYEEKQAEQ